MKKITLTGALALLCSILSAQKNTIAPFGIHDRLPDMAIHNLLNYQTPVATFKQLQGNYTKMLLVDFWFTTCAPCVKQIPKMLAIQEQFKEELQIVMVTFEPDSIVQQFMARWEQQNHKKLNLPIVTADTLLQQLFLPSQAPKPNYAWVAADGVYMAHTSSVFATAATVQEVLGIMRQQVKNRGYLSK